MGAAWNEGLVVVVAGNDGRTGFTQGYGTINVPGNSPSVITVGAWKTQGQAAKVASYSSKGPTMIDHVVKPDLVASGNRMLSLRAPGSTLETLFAADPVPFDVYSEITSQFVLSYFQLSGTSMSAAVASRGVALVLQANPNYTPDRVEVLLMATAYKFSQKTSVAVDALTGVSYTSTYDIFTVGAGDLNAAVALTVTTVPPAISMQSPTVAYDRMTTTVSLVSPNLSLWGSNALWGNSANAAFNSL